MAPTVLLGFPKGTRYGPETGLSSAIPGGLRRGAAGAGQRYGLARTERTVIVDGRRFDSWTRVLASGLPRRAALKAVFGASLAGAASRASLRQAEADGHLGDHCNKNNPCKKPLVCINTECDHCLTSGTCHQGWCCEGYTCDGAECVQCSGHDRALGVEGCRKRKKKKKKKH
jgi:hypothetical protein